MQYSDKDRNNFFRHLAQTSPEPLGVKILRAEGVFLYGEDDKRYVDLISGVSVSNLGHNHPAVMSAVRNQLDKHTHLMVYGEFIQSSQTDYAAELVKYLGKPFESVYFVNSGSEAIDGAMKLAKRVTGRHEIVSCYNAYHGSSQGALSIMGSETYKTNFRPLMPSCKLIHFNSEADLKNITRETACVFVEPVQGEAGYIVPENGYLLKLRARCNETGTLLVFDEVQTGFGRTGSLFAFQKYNVIPDIICLAKALGGGFPLGAFVSSFKNMNTLTYNPVLGHITTFGGHPVSCAAGLASLKFISETKIYSLVAAKTELFKQKLSSQPHVKEFRESGFLMALVFDSADFCLNVVTECLNLGVVSDWFLFEPNAMRLCPPLVISNDEINLSCEIISNAINIVSKNR